MNRWGNTLGDPTNPIHLDGTAEQVSSGSVEGEGLGDRFAALAMTEVPYFRSSSGVSAVT